MTRKNVEDQHRAIDDRHRNYLFQIFALARTQVVQDEHEGGIALAHEFGDLTRLAASHERCRIDMRALLHDAIDDLRADSARQRFEFYELGFERSVGVVRVDSDDNRSISQRSPSL